VALNVRPEVTINTVLETFGKYGPINMMIIKPNTTKIDAYKNSQQFTIRYDEEDQGKRALRDTHNDEETTKKIFRARDNFKFTIYIPSSERHKSNL